MNNPLDPSLRNLAPCDCCSGTEPSTPAQIDNRPGQEAVTFRSGTHSQFKASLLAGLTLSERAALGGLATRSDDDFTIALLDGFAAMADVLTFYSERIANESFLRTATERRSVLELARAIGYELRPGVSATASLAFTVEDAPGAPGFAIIKQGTKVQSVPGPEEKPQTYETSEELEARKEWNELRPRQTIAQEIKAGLTRLFFKGTSTQLQPGDGILIVGDERDKNSGSTIWEFRIIKTVVLDRTMDRTLVTWDSGLTNPPLQNPSVFAFRQRAALFGHNAPEFKSFSRDFRRDYLDLSTTAAGPTTTPGTVTLNPGLISGVINTPVVPGVAVANPGPGELVNPILTTPGPLVNPVINNPGAEVINPAVLTPVAGGVTNPAISTPVAGGVTPGLANPVAGGNAAGAGGVNPELTGHVVPGLTRAAALSAPGGATTAIANPPGTILAGPAITAVTPGTGIAGPISAPGVVVGGITSSPDLSQWPHFNIAYADSVTSVTIVYLDTVYPKVSVDSWIVLANVGNLGLAKVQGVSTTARSEFTLSLKVTQVTLDASMTTALFGLRETVVFAQSEKLDLAEVPVPQPVSGNSIELDRIVEGLQSGKRLLLKGTSPVKVQLASVVAIPSGLISSDRMFDLLQPASPEPDGTQTWLLRDAAGHIAFLRTKPENVKVLTPDANNPQIEAPVLKNANLSSDGQRTVLQLQQDSAEPALKNIYDPAVLRIFANVVLATHGETVREILGNGDSALPHQKYKLKQAPLTFTPATTPTGSETSLQVWVNDINWREVDSLYARGPRERIFVSRRADDGSTTLTFGDGKSGARLPGGYENIRSVYRKGIGLSGLVKSGQLSLLLPPPLGVKGVTNPAPSSGAQDPEELDEARQNAPIQVLTFGRIVGLKDYEDFSRTFSGIAKANVTWTWTSSGRGVFVSVVAPEGKELPEDGGTVKALKKSLSDFGNPLVPIRVKVGVVTKFSIAGTISVAADYLPDKVKAAVDSALLARFSFGSASFGGTIALSEIFAIIQNVPGVNSVDIDELRYVGRNAPGDPLNTLLPALRPKPGVAAQSAQPAELLVLDENSLVNLIASAV